MTDSICCPDRLADDPEIKNRRKQRLDNLNAAVAGSFVLAFIRGYLPSGERGENSMALPDVRLPEDDITNRALKSV